MGAPMSKYLDPKSDLVFKRFFGERPHEVSAFTGLSLAEVESLRS